MIEKRQGVTGMKSKTKLILDELQKLFNGKVEAFEFSCYFSRLVFENYDQIEREYEGLAYYLDQVVPDICAEGEPGLDPTHMIGELKKVYEKALEIINKNN